MAKELTPEEKEEKRKQKKLRRQERRKEERLIRATYTNYLQELVDKLDEINLYLSALYDSKDDPIIINSDKSVTHINFDDTLNHIYRIYEELSDTTKYDNDEIFEWIVGKIHPFYGEFVKEFAFEINKIPTLLKYSLDKATSDDRIIRCFIVAYTANSQVANILEEIIYHISISDINKSKPDFVHTGLILKVWLPRWH